MKTAGDIIEHFCGFATPVLLGSGNLHSLRNVMLVVPVVHTCLDELDLWLTPFEVSTRGFESTCHGLTVITQLQDHGKILADK